MLKIKNVHKIKGKIVNGCRVVDIEYSSVDRGYIFTMSDEHELNPDNSGQLLIKLLDNQYKGDEFLFFIMGWKTSTQKIVTKKKIGDMNGFANCMYTLIEKGINVKKGYNR